MSHIVAPPRYRILALENFETVLSILRAVLSLVQSIIKALDLHASLT